MVKLCPDGAKDVTPPSYLAWMVEREGGIDAILEWRPNARNPGS